MNIKKQDHFETLIGSLNKMFLNAKNKGVVRNKELSLLNLIYKILDKRCYNLNTNKTERELLSIYYKLLNKYNILCKPTLSRDYLFQNTNINQTFIAEEDYIYPMKKKIFYWQEEDYITKNSDIIPLVSTNNYLINKSSDSYNIFENGKDIVCNNVGRICFLVLDSDNVNYQIIDFLGNNINNTFDITAIEDIKSTLFVSQNIYSHGTINFKIKKI